MSCRVVAVLPATAAAGRRKAGCDPIKGCEEEPGRAGPAGSATGFGHSCSAPGSARHTSVMSTNPSRPVSPATGRGGKCDGVYVRRADGTLALFWVTDGDPSRSYRQGV